MLKGAIEVNKLLLLLLLLLLLHYAHGFNSLGY